MSYDNCILWKNKNNMLRGLELLNELSNLATAVWMNHAAFLSSYSKKIFAYMYTSTNNFNKVHDTEVKDVDVYDRWNMRRHVKLIS